MPKLPADAIALLRRDFEVLELTPAYAERIPVEWAGRVAAIASPGRDPGLGRRLDSRIYDQLPHLELVASFSSGLDGIDVEEAERRGCRVTNAADALVEPVADIALGLVIDVVRGMSAGDRFIRTGAWATKPKTASSALAGKTTGILGLGRIGKALARRLTACGMEITYTGRTRQDVPYPFVADIHALARASDVLVACCPLTPETCGLVDGAVLSALGADGFFVNIARGDVADENALIAALSAGTIAGAGLDVYRNEPDIDPRFFDLENAVLLPHLGGATEETRAAMYQSMFDSLRRHFGLPRS